MKQIEFEGQIHEFPDDFTDKDIAKALSPKKQTKSVSKDFEEDKRNLIARGFDAIRTGMASPIAFGRYVDQRIGFGPEDKSFTQNIEDVRAGIGASGGSNFGTQALQSALTDPAALITGPMGWSYQGAKTLLPRLFKAGVQGFKEGAVGAGINQAEAISKGQGDLSTGATQAGLSTAFPMVGALGKSGLNTLKSGMGTLADVFRKTEALDKSIKTGAKTLKTRQGFTLTPAMTTGQPFLRAIETEAQSNPFLADIAGEFADKNRMRFGELMGELSASVPKSKGLDAVPSSVGMDIEQSLRSAKSDISKGFSGAEEATVSTLKKAPNVSDDIVGVLQSKISGPLGTERISDEASNYLAKKAEQAKALTTPKELLDFRRKIADEVDMFSKGERPVFGGRDESAFKDVYKAINNRIGESFGYLGEQGKILKDVWDLSNQKYSVGRGALEGVSKKLGIGTTVPADVYMKRIESIGGEKLQELADIATKDKDIKPLFKTMQGAFFDNFLKKSVKSGTDEFSIDKLATNWNKIDEGTKKAMVPEKVIKEMDELLRTLKTIQSTDAYAFNPSGTAVTKSFIDKVKNIKEAMLAGMMRGPLKAYYDQGESGALKTFLSFAGKSTAVMDEADKLFKNKAIQTARQIAGPLAPVGYNISRQSVRSYAND